MKHLLLLSLAVLSLNTAVYAQQDPIVVNLPANGSITLGNYNVRCDGPSQPQRPSTYVCAAYGRSATGTSIDGAFARLQSMLPSNQRCFSDMTAECKRDYCAKE